MRLILTQHYEGSDLLFRMTLTDGDDEAVQPLSVRYAVYGEDDRVVKASAAAVVDGAVASMAVPNDDLVVLAGRTMEIMAIEVEATLFDSKKVSGRHQFRVRAMNLIGD